VDLNATNQYRPPAQPAVRTVDPERRRLTKPVVSTAFGILFDPAFNIDHV
jgi:hypothetical protein